jgi:hypothetical protein
MKENNHEMTQINTKQALVFRGGSCRFVVSFNPLGKKILSLVAMRKN